MCHEGTTMIVGIILGIIIGAILVIWILFQILGALF